MLSHSREKKDLMNITKLNTLKKLAGRVVKDFMQFFCLNKKQSPKGCINHLCNYRRRRKVLKAAIKRRQKEALEDIWTERSPRGYLRD